MNLFTMGLKQAKMGIFWKKISRHSICPMIVIKLWPNLFALLRSSRERKVQKPWKLTCYDHTIDIGNDCLNHRFSSAQWHNPNFLKKWCLRLLSIYLLMYIGCLPLVKVLRIWQTKLVNAIQAPTWLKVVQICCFAISM